MSVDIEQQIKTIIASCLAVSEDQLNPDIQLVDDLYADSLALLDIMIRLNDEFDIDLGGDELLNFKTVSNVRQEVEKQLAWAKESQMQSLRPSFFPGKQSFNRN